jgi:hypothetical protein
MRKKDILRSFGENLMGRKGLKAKWSYWLILTKFTMSDID